MFIRMLIVNKESGEKKTVETEGSNEAFMLLKFMAKAGRYANPGWKIVRVETDSVMVAEKIREERPWINMELIETESF